MYKLIALIGVILLSGQVNAADIDFGLDETTTSLSTIEAEIVEDKAAAKENKKQVSEFVKELKLTTEQIEKAKQISEANREKMEQLQNNIKDILQQSRKLEEQSLNEFAQILTDEQKTKFNEFMNLRNDELKAHDNEINDVMAPFDE